MDNEVRIRRTDRKLAYKGAYLNIYADTIVTPDNKTVTYDHIDHPGAAAVIAVDESGRIVIVRQFRNSIDSYSYELPAGGLEPGEDGAVAAMRELEEESGYIATEVTHFIDVYSVVAFSNELVKVYIAKDIKLSQQKLDDEEYIDVCLFTPKELSDMIYSGEIKDSKTIAAIMAYINRFGHNID